jgi:O-succinylbenzoic acid--CoA ligase
VTEITCPLKQAAERFADQPALIDSRQIISYRQYYGLVSGAASALNRSGAKQSDRIAVALDNSIEQVIILMACLKAAAVVCPVNPRLPQKALQGCLKQAGIGFLVANGGHTGGGTRTLTISDLLADTGAEREPAETVDLTREATIMFTSGSSAAPKAILHTYGNHYYSALGANGNIALGPGDRWLLSLPLYHVGGLGILFRALLGGGAVVVAESGKGLSDTLMATCSTHVSLVPTQLYRLLFGGNDPVGLSRQLKAVLLGGGPVSGRLVETALAHDLPLFLSYGLTETASQLTASAPGDLPRKCHTSGKPLAYRRLEIDPDGEILAGGEVLSPGLVEEGRFLPRPSGSRHRTGDIGRLDKDGYLIVTGRKDNMFICGGENIYPEEIEIALLNLLHVAEVVVVPVADREWGHRPVAFVGMDEGFDIDSERLRAALAERLPRFKVPRTFHPWPGEVAAGFKPDRRALAALAAEIPGEDT